MENPPNNPLDVIAGRDQEIGPSVAIFIIMILLVMGAIYFWKEESGKSPASPATTTEIVIYEHPTPQDRSVEATATENADGLNF